MLLDLYRSLPLFRGKFRLGKQLFRRSINKATPGHFRAHYGILYAVPNTIENLYAELKINGVYEKPTLLFLRHIINEGDVFFDVGANIGSMAMAVCKAKKQIRYYGFEPTPQTFTFLQRNLIANNIQYNLVQKAVAASSGEFVKFYHSPYSGKNSFAPVYSGNFINVETISLDDFCSREGIEKIDLLKIDVQGFEILVFRGAQQLLRERRIGKIVFEFEDWAETSAGFLSGEAQSYLMERGYRLQKLNGENITTPLVAGGEMILAKPV